MAFKQRHKDLKEVVSQLRSAVNAHGKQADIIEEHILKNFEENGLFLLDYEITYRPLNKNDDLEPYNITRH